MKFIIYIFKIVIVLSLFGCSDDNQTSNEEVIRPVVWTTVKVHDLTQVRKLSGILQANKTAILSFEVSGKIKEVKVSPGDNVKKDDVLASIETKSYVLNFQAMEAQLQQANAKLKDIQMELTRYLKLYDKGFTSNAKIDDLKASLKIAQTNVEVAKAKLALGKKDIVDTTLKAPYNGTIVRRMIEPSQQITAKQTVLEINGEGNMKIAAMIPETMINNLKLNTKMEISFPAMKNINGISAYITEIGTSTKTANAFPVVLTLESSHPSLRTGMTVEINFSYLSREMQNTNNIMTKIPVSAITVGKQESKYVFVYDTDKEIVNKRLVEVMNIINNEVIINTGLTPEEIIVTAGVDFLHDGQKVNLMDPNVKIFN